MVKDSGQASIEMKPSIIELVDSNGYTRRMVVREGSSCLPRVSFHDFISHIRKIFNIQNNIEMRMVYKREDSRVVAVENDMEFEAACLDIMPSQSLQRVVFEKKDRHGRWEKVIPGQPANTTKYPELSDSVGGWI